MTPKTLRTPIFRYLAILLLIATARLSLAADAWTRDDAAHLLRRAGFGGTPQQIDALHALGRDAPVDSLLTGKPPEGAQPVFPAVTFTEFTATPLPKPDANADRKELYKTIQRL